MTDEQLKQCVRVTMAVMAISSQTAILVDSSKEVATVLRVALFLCDEYIAHPERTPDDYTAVIREMIEQELGIT